jgi:hypothetical protein
MGDHSVPAIFEAAFVYGDIRVRVDVMERLASGRWGLREVKSSSGLKDHYLNDIALQAYVVRGAGVAVNRNHRGVVIACLSPTRSRRTGALPEIMARQRLDRRSQVSTPLLGAHCRAA